MLTDKEKMQIVESEMTYISSIQKVLSDAMLVKAELTDGTSEYINLLELQNMHIYSILELF